MPDKAYLLASVCNSNVLDLGSYICNTGAVHNFSFRVLNALSHSVDHSNLVAFFDICVSGNAISLKDFMYYLKYWAKPTKR
jgi:hypothetical protein